MKQLSRHRDVGAPLATCGSIQLAPMGRRGCAWRVHRLLAGKAGNGHIPLPLEFHELQTQSWAPAACKGRWEIGAVRLGRRERGLGEPHLAALNVILLFKDRICVFKGPFHNSIAPSGIQPRKALCSAAGGKQAALFCV